jgi:hypothetical protein
MSLSFFHHFPSSSIRLLTIEVGLSTNGGGCTLYVDGEGNHLSSQIRAFFPFPVHHINPFLTKSIELCILLQAKDGFFPKGALRIDPLGWYLAATIRASRLLGVFHKRQTCLANKALLKQVKSWKNPFCSSSSSESVSSSPYAQKKKKKLCIKELISKHKAFVSMKTLMQ